MIINVCLMIMGLISCMPSSATIFVQGNSTSPLTFTSAVAAKTFDPATGTLYLGLASGAADFAVSKITRPIATTVTTPIFTGIGSNTILTNNGIAALTLATSQGNTNPFIVGNLDNAGYTNPNTLFAMNNTGSVVIQTTATILDAAGASSSGTVAIAASQNFIFASVAPDGGTFGQDNSGIAVVRLDATTTTPSAPSQLVQTAAVPGSSTVQAQRFDPTTPQLNPGTGTPTIANAMSLYWDDPLQILYMGTTVTASSNVGDGARSVVVGSNQNGALNLLNIAPNGAFNMSNTTNIVGVINPTASVHQILTLNKLRVMHTTTGPSYLIVNGANGSAGITTTIFNNMIFALPLVDNPLTPSIHGTLADKTQAPLSVKNADLGTFAFTDAATTNAALPASTDPAALVGAGPFPLQASSFISDMVVIGDTVYASSAIPQSTTNDVGIFYSQAMFDNTGKIVRWTPWSQRVFPFNGLTGAMTSAAIDFFAVDAVSGNVWGIGGDTAQTVALTQWDHGTSPGLVAQLNTLTPNGYYSVLDLNQTTNGLGAATPSRYALFGGSSQVTFALTSTSLAASTPFNVSSGVPAAQSLTTDFTQPQNFLTTNLPGNAGTVTTLEFSRSTANLSNYFFAGTPSGLYVYSDNQGNGFTINPDTFGTLNSGISPSISTGIWQKAPNIPGAIVDVVTSGQTLYVLTFQTSATIPYLSVLYNIPFQTTVAAMFAPSNISIIAQSNTNPVFSSTLLFNGMQIIKTGASTNDATLAAKEQLVLATNTGLYISNADQTVGNGIISATNQTLAQWEQQDSVLYDDVAGMDTPFPATVWPISTVDQNGFNTFDVSSISQISGSGNTAGTEANFTAPGIPNLFNGSSTTPAFATLQPITYFFSDGARRLFVANAMVNNPAATTILSFPWDVQTWNVTDPATTQFLYPALSSSNGFFWVKQIGATGIVMAGTNQGIVALE